MKNYFNLKKSKLLLLTLLTMLVVGVRPAWAQKVMPYSYGFEEASCSTSGWTKVNCHSSSENYKLGTSDAYEGSYAFRFYYTSNYPQYLISPELATSSYSISVSFWYKAHSTSYEESFKVGYSTTDTETSSFTFGDEVKTESTNWQEYTTTCPAGTKYICIACTSNDQYGLYIDNLVIDSDSPYKTPKAFASTGVTATTATFGWTAGGDETAWQIAYSTTKGFDADAATKVDVTSNPYTLEGLTAETTYYARIRADYGSGNYSAWSDEVSFKPTNAIDLTVNDGTTMNNYVPFNGNYADTQGTMSQFIIPASSLTAMQGRQIQDMTFYTSTATKDFGNARFDVYMAETSTTAFDVATFEWGDMDQVAASATVNIADGKMTITLDNGFEYSGDNLKIGFKLVLTGGYTATSWYGIAVEKAAIKSYVSNGSTNASIESFLPKITFTSMPGPAVKRPRNLAVTPSSTTAEVTWTGDAETFDIDVNGTVTEGVASPYTLENLTPVTTYSVRVRARSGDDVSDWSSIVSFTTDCGAYDIPYTYGFEEEAPFGCWKAISGAVTRKSGSYNTGTWRLDFRGTASNMIALPQFNAPTNTLRVEFYTRPESTGGSSGKFAIGYMTDIADASTFVALETYNSTEMIQSYVKKKVDFASAPADAIIAMRQYDCSTNYYWYVDDVTVKAIPSCKEPDNLTASDVTARTATLSWDSEASEWIVAYKAADEADFTEVQAVTGNPYTLTGLTPETAYTVKVRTDCGGGNLSEWSDPVSFTTDILCPVPTGLAVADITNHQATASWNGIAESYQVMIGELVATGPTLDFEDQQIPATFTNSTVYPWKIQESGYNSSSYCIIPGNKGVKSSASDLTCEVTGPCTVSFYAKISSERWDKGFFLIDNTEELTISGTTDWTEYSFELGEGTHTLIWRYKKDSSADSGDDLFYVDNITMRVVSSWAEYPATGQSYTFSGLTSETIYQVKVKGNYGTDGYSVETHPVSFTTGSDPFKLDDDKDNSAIIAANAGKVADVTLTRTLQTGGWNTFAVPFDLDIPTGWTVKELTASDFNSENGVLSLTFADAESIEAGKPYLVKVSENVVNPTFSGVTVSSAATTKETTAVDFIPTLGATTITANAQNILFLSAGNKLYKPAAADSQQMKGFRAYFLLKGDAAAARTFRMDFGDGDTNGIVAIGNDATAPADNCYDLSGRKVVKPANSQMAKGVYIVNGKKKVIK